MKEPLFLNTATALYTPITDGKIDYDAFSELVENQIAAGISALVFLGTTGESPTVTQKEREEITRFAAETVKKRIPVIIGCGSNCTEKAIALVKSAKSAGADGALVVTPYYNKCNERGLIAHYEKISKEGNLPIILYNVPKRTGVNIAPETAEKLSAIKNVVGLKEANDDKKHYLSTLGKLRGKIAVYCGSDGEVFDFLNAGASGSVSVASNIIPAKFSDIYYNFKKYSESDERKFQELFSALFCDVNPIPLKTFVRLSGKKGYELRLPLFPPDEKKTEYISEVLYKLKAWRYIC
ncbi:MAG TPA: 4-hydroxy-tetrahydrodipicolinate synthase [Clostridiales bacterium]|nr:4-hydroxy-tetrahydrodipicolinate synthase [Clostridiales bacterium]